MSLSDYLEGLDKTRDQHQYGWMLDRLNDNYYQHCQLVVHRGNYGFAVDPCRELIGVWSHGGGYLETIVEQARKLGAERLTCYDAGLPAMYEKYGCKVIERAPFSEAFATDRWVPTVHGTPDYVTMKV